MQCLQQHEYLQLLPCLYQSNWGTKYTKQVGPIEDADLAHHILHIICHGTWQAQYKLKADTVRQCIHDLIDDLKKIKKTFLTEQEQPGKERKTYPSNSNKQRMGLLNEPILKKPHKDAKHCSLCKKHGGAHTTNNTVD